MAGPRGNRAVIYVRESLDRYGDERAVDRFEQQCRQLVKARGLRLLIVLRDNDVRASNGNKGDGFAEVLRMLRDRETDYVVIPVVDRFFRTMRDLEDVIDICLETGAALVAASGEIDLSHDQGRLVARLLTSVAKAETERKGARQRAANEQAAKKGTRRTSVPRPFGWQAVYVPDPKAEGGQRREFVKDEAEAGAIRWAADALLGGGTVSAVMREWNRRGLRSHQKGGKPFSRSSVTTILRNPALAGLSTYKDEIVGAGQWEAILPEETWRAVDALLTASDRTITFTRQGETVTRKIRANTPRGVRTLLGGLAACACGNVVTGSVNHLGQHVYRCQPPTRDGRPGPHVAVRAEPVDEWVTAAVLGELSRRDLADLVTPPPHADTAGLRAEAAAIRRNLDELGADRALGLVSRSQMLAATGRGNARLAEIAAGLAEAAGKGALAPFTRGQAAAAVWAGLDLSRRREVIRALTAVTLHPAGRGARSYDLGAKVDMPGLRGRESA
jgi:DNA invertase Pin-like site-specific DNA recombinase